MGKKIKIILGILAIFMIVGNIGYGESLTEEKEEIYMDKIDNNAEFDEDINRIGDIGVKVENDKEIIKGNNITITGNNGNGVHTISQEIFNEPPSTIIIEGKGEVTITGQEVGVGIVYSKGEISGDDIEIIGRIFDGIQVSESSEIAIEGRGTVKITGADNGVYFSESFGTISGKNIDIIGNDYNGIGIFDSDITITGDENVSIRGNDYGVNLQEGSTGNISGKNIDITGINGIFLSESSSITIDGKEKTYIDGEEVGVWIQEDGEIIIKSSEVIIQGKTDTGIFAAEGGSVKIDSKNSFIFGEEYSLQAIYGEITLSENGSHEIYGNIESYGDASIKIGGKGNKISSSSNNEPLKVTAEDGGEIDISLVDGILTGIVDDGRAAGANTNGGTISLNLNNGTWKTQGKSFVTSIDLRNNGNIIFTEEGTSVDIKKLNGDGNGTFGMTVNAINKSEGNMLYVKESNGGIYNVSLQNSNLEDIKIGEKIRFATIGNNAKTNNLGFKVADIKERGIRNINFKVEKEEFDKNDSENEIYNGGQTPNDKKPGNDYVVGNYQDGENWYLTRNSSGNINDGGITIIEMAKSNYANAVYMDNLNKRLGDMSFADGESGLWVRMRNDKVGEDNHYKLHNYMTQIGYDKSYSMENGIEHRGIAFEYGKGDMKYKELRGNTDTDKYILTLYKTKVRDNKVYTDYTLRGGAISNDFTVYGRETGAKVTGKYKNMVLGAGTEVGKRYELDKNWYIEPQAQLQYTYINSTDYTTNQMTKVDLNEIHSLIGRAGIKLGHDSYKGNKKDNTVYVKADINHEFLGEQNVKAKDETGRLDKTYKNNETWVEIGIGASKKITPDLNVYADVEKQLGSNKDNKNWQVNVGFRYKF
ncbi:autotransporter outer membrane beta-barrel domain-containing protein [Fusobacterium varium]